MLEFLAVTGWLLAAVIFWAALGLRSEADRQRRARGIADYAIHKAEQRIAELQRERDALILRLGRRQGEAEDLREIATAAYLASQMLAPAVE